MSDIGQALAKAAFWAPLATIMAFTSLMLSDSRFVDDSSAWKSIAVRVIPGPLMMAVAGFLISSLSTPDAIVAVAKEKSLSITPAVEAAGHYASLFIAGQIGLFVLALCLIVQVAELLRVRARSLIGKQMQLVRDGTTLRLLFHPSGEAQLYSVGQGVLGISVRQGVWQQFPEGSVVKWAGEQSGGKEGNYGFISSSGDSLMYEGYTEEFEGAADFIAQIRFKTSVGRETRIAEASAARAA